MKLFVVLMLSLWTIVSVHAAERPNVVIILADDLGWGDYSAFGTKDIRTPGIDRLCREGLTFGNFYANSCVCSPTRRFGRVASVRERRVVLECDRQQVDRIRMSN